MTHGERWVSVHELRDGDLFEWEGRQYLVVIHNPDDDRIPIPTDEQLEAHEMDPQEKTILAQCIDDGGLVSLGFKGGPSSKAGEFQDGWPCVKLCR